MATLERKQVSDVIMVYVDNNISDKHDLGNLSKGDLVKMLYKVANSTDYWNLVKNYKILED